MTTNLMLAELPSLMGLYTIALIVGGGLVVFSAITGSDADSDVGDVDFGGDVDIDVAADADVDLGDVELGADAGESSAFELSDWLSLRFLIYFAAMFGLTGTVLTVAGDLSRMTTLIASVVCGAIIGQFVHQMMRWLVKGSSNSSTAHHDYVNRIARVTVPIAPGGRGEVAIRINDGERYLPAVPKRDDESFAVGATVGICALQAGMVVVISQKEHDFLREAKQ